MNIERSISANHIGNKAKTVKDKDNEQFIKHIEVKPG